MEYAFINAPWADGNNRLIQADSKEEALAIFAQLSGEDPINWIGILINISGERSEFIFEKIV